MNHLLRVGLFSIVACASACAAHSTLPVETQTEMLSHYVHGESLNELAREFKLADTGEARVVVHDALVSLYRRYYNDK
jgi:hypothetical protein